MRSLRVSTEKRRQEESLIGKSADVDPGRRSFAWTLPNHPNWLRPPSVVFHTQLTNANKYTG